MNENLKDTISFSPVSSGVASGRAYRLDFSSDMDVKVQPCILPVLLFLIVWLILPIVTLYIGLQKKEIIPILFGGLFISVAIGILLSRLRIKARFDLFTKEFIRWGQRISLNDIAALQIVEKTCPSKHSHFTCFELNLVLTSGERVNVLYHGAKEAFMEEAQQLSQILCLPIWTQDAILPPDVKHQTVKRQNNPVSLLIIGLLFLCIPLIIIFMTFAIPVKNMFQSRNWLTCPAIITHSALDSTVSHSKRGRSRVYRIDIKADYNFQGQSYTCTKYDFFRSDSYTNIGVKGMENTIAEYPVGKNITCHVNPASPQDSVINNRNIPTATYAPLLFCCPFLLIGLYFLKKVLGRLWFSDCKERFQE